MGTGRVRARVGCHSVSEMSATILQDVHLCGCGSPDGIPTKMRMLNDEEKFGEKRGGGTNWEVGINCEIFGKEMAKMSLRVEMLERVVPQECGGRDALGCDGEGSSSDLQGPNC